MPTRRASSPPDPKKGSGNILAPPRSAKGRAAGKGDTPLPRPPVTTDKGDSPLYRGSGGAIRVGIGGWTYEPWRGVFYPDDLPHACELEFASREVTAIEINSTYHRHQSPGTFEKWAASVPPGFVFTVKASFVCTNRKDLATVGDAIERFFAQGVTRLGDKLGPILWQLMPHKTFVAGEIDAFLALLPRERDGIALRHALEVRHESFRTPQFVEMARRAGVGIVVADSPEFPQIADLTADFVYARLRNARERYRTGYPPREIASWAAAARAWTGGASPEGLAYVSPPPATKDRPRDLFLFVIDGAKVRAPAAAAALLRSVK